MMISPSDGVPGRGLDWFFVATEACGGVTSDLGFSRGFLEYLGIYRAKRRCGRPPRWAQPTWACLGPQARPGGLCSPRISPLVLLWPTRCLLVHKKSPKSFAAFGFHLVLIFCEVKNKQKITTMSRETMGTYGARAAPCWFGRGSRVAQRADQRGGSATEITRVDLPRFGLPRGVKPYSCFGGLMVEKW